MYIQLIENIIYYIFVLGNDISKVLARLSVFRCLLLHTVHSILIRLLVYMLVPQNNFLASFIILLRIWFIGMLSLISISYTII